MQLIKIGRLHWAAHIVRMDSETVSGRLLNDDTTEGWKTQSRKREQWQ